MSKDNKYSWLLSYSVKYKSGSIANGNIRISKCNKYLWETIEDVDETKKIIKEYDPDNIESVIILNCMKIGNYDE